MSYQRGTLKRLTSSLINIPLRLARSYLMNTTHHEKGNEHKMVTYRLWCVCRVGSNLVCIQLGTYVSLACSACTVQEIVDQLIIRLLETLLIRLTCFDIWLCHQVCVLRVVCCIVLLLFFFKVIVLVSVNLSHPINYSLVTSKLEY